MIVDRYDPVNLFELVPKLKLEMEPELAELDVLLDDDELFAPVKADLFQRHPNSGRLGRHSTPVEVILRMLLVKKLYGWSYEQTERFVCDSIVLRQFCRLYLESAPDDTTLIRWANPIGAPTLAALNDRAVELARRSRSPEAASSGPTARWSKPTSTIPPTTPSSPDGVRVISRLVGRAKDLIPRSVPHRPKGSLSGTAPVAPRDWRTRSRKMALRRTQEAKATYQAAYERLVEVAKASIKQAEQVRSMLEDVPSAPKILEEISHFAGLLERVVSQAHRRVLEGEQVPAREKLLSIFEEHTAVIRRGKARKQTEFGRKVWLSEVDGGIVSGFRILEGNAGDEAQLEPALEDHLRLFGKVPELVAADRNVHSKENEQIAKEMGVKKVCLPKAGKKSTERQEHERQRWYKRARRFRAGIEGRISVMKRREYLGRCRDRGEEGFGRWVGWGVLTANLDTIAQTLAAR